MNCRGGNIWHLLSSVRRVSCNMEGGRLIVSLLELTVATPLFRSLVLQNCLDKCNEKFSYPNFITDIGVTNGNQCWCNSNPKYDDQKRKVDRTGNKCSKKACPGDKKLACGSGKWMIRYLDDDMAY